MRKDCECGWVNDWKDSGDRGAAAWMHKERECPNRPECNAILGWKDGQPHYCKAAPHPEHSRW